MALSREHTKAADVTL